MNETMNTIKTRRSIRKFKAEQVSYPEIQELIEAAIYTPSAGNQQKWHFSVIQDKETLNRMVYEIKDNMAKSGNDFFVKRASVPTYHTFYNAPTVILISAEDKNAMAPFDCAAASQTIALAAASLKIGTCIITSSAFLFASERGKEMKKNVGIPEGYSHVCTIAVGYPDGPNPEAPPRKKDVVSYIK
jgi:nitroreductase